MKDKPMEVDMQNVTVLRRKGQAALVEWFANNQPHRATVPVADLVLAPDSKSGSIPIEKLAQGIEYGIAWETFVTDYRITAEQIAAAMRAHGVWTVEDYESNPQQVIGAISSLYAPLFNDLANAVKSIKHKEA